MLQQLPINPPDTEEPECPSGECGCPGCKAERERDEREYQFGRAVEAGIRHVIPWRKHAELFKRLADAAPSQFEREQRMADYYRFMKRAEEQDANHGPRSRGSGASEADADV